MLGRAACVDVGDRTVSYKNRGRGCIEQTAGTTPNWANGTNIKPKSHTIGTNMGLTGFAALW